jgi:hypothetical protein
MVSSVPLSFDIGPKLETVVPAAEAGAKATLSLDENQRCWKALLISQCQARAWASGIVAPCPRLFSPHIPQLRSVAGQSVLFRSVAQVFECPGRCLDPSRHRRRGVYLTFGTLCLCRCRVLIGIYMLTLWQVFLQAILRAQTRLRRLV